MKKLFVFIVFVVVMLFTSPGHAMAVTYDLLAPSGQLVRGQDVNFTINIDTEGHSFSSTQIGMTYDTAILEYVSVSPGSTFTTVAADLQENGRIIITGSSTSGYSGSGSFAVVTFNIIAQSSGSTQLCTLFNPSTPTPTTAAPAPTNLPKSGSFAESGRGIISGLVMVAIAVISLILFKKA